MVIATIDTELLYFDKDNRVKCIVPRKRIEIRAGEINKGRAVISEDFGSEKPALANFEYFINRYPECHDFTYVGDNPRKDLIAPNALGWLNVCLKDDGRNIHKQDFTSITAQALPKKTIESLKELI